VVLMLREEAEEAKYDLVVFETDVVKVGRMRHRRMTWSCIQRIGS
jgi:hypothetical protein